MSLKPSTHACLKAKRQMILEIARENRVLRKKLFMIRIRSEFTSLRHELLHRWGLDHFHHCRPGGVWHRFENQVCLTGWSALMRGYIRALYFCTNQRITDYALTLLILCIFFVTKSKVNIRL